MVIQNSINNTVGGSNSGATNTLTVTNSSNTASSSALVNVSVGGTSAGDALTTYTVSGTTNWSMGIDNSASDSFVISQGTVLGTNNIMSALTTGEINYPLQPAFLVYLSATTGAVTGDNTIYTVALNTEVFDQNGDFDVTTFTFTAPVTGRYYLSHETGLEGLTASHTAVNFRINTSNRIYYNANLNAGAARNAANNLAQCGAMLCDMDAGDIATLVVQVLNGAKTVLVSGTASTGTFFSGYLAA